MSSGSACIVGIGETDYCRKPGSGLSQLGLQLKAAVSAIEEAGLPPSQIDGIMPFPHLGRAEEFAANLGCSNLRFASTVHMGGAAPVASLQVASAAIEAGMADYVLLPAGWNGYISDDRFAQLRFGRVNTSNAVDNRMPVFRISNGDGHSIIADRWNGLSYLQRLYVKLNAGD